ncbi:hypothetical protein OROHE_000106 [Orobanche hederae]
MPSNPGAAIMGHSGVSPTVTAERSSPTPPNSSGKRQRHHDRQRRRKKQNFVSTETDIRFRVHTLKPELPCTFSTYTCRHTSPYVRSADRRGKEWRIGRNHSQRKWTYSAHDVSNYNDRVVILSYNVLGVENARKHPELYRSVSPKFLKWESRKMLLCKEVKAYQAGILCFQEVDHFDDLNEILGKDGFRGLYKARAGDTHDGCAIFWNSGLFFPLPVMSTIYCRFSLLHEENIEFQRFGLRNNIAQFCVLKNESRSSQNRCYCKMRIFLEKAYELSQKWGRIPVVLTGDLNSLPQSAIFRQLHIQQHDRRHISGQIFRSEYLKSQSRGCASNYCSLWSKPKLWTILNGFTIAYHRIGGENNCRDAAQVCSMILVILVCANPFDRWTDEELMLATGSRLNSSLRHHLKLCSAYAEVPGSPEVRDKIGEPLATSYHSLFTGTVDYIWHTLDLVPVKVLETLSMHSLKQTGGLPSKKWGSDHLAVVCELAFVDGSD